MIFVTGGTGFLGRHLIPALCQAGLPARVLTRTPQAHTWLQRYPNIDVIAGDLRDAATVHQAMQGCNQVIHAAGLFSMWGSAGSFEANNVGGTENVMTAAVAHGVERLVYVSTVAVIGTPQPGQRIDETHPPRPADPYQRSKLLAEQVIHRYHAQQPQVQSIILRPGAFYGPYGDYAFNRLFFTDPMRGIIMQMDGGHYTIFPVYVGDVARSILLALQHGTPGQIYNICGECLSHRQAFDIICAEANLHWPRLNLPGWLGINFSRFLEALSHITGREPFWPVNLRSYVFNDWYVSSEKAKRDLCFTPISFTQGVQQTLRWYRQGQPDTLPELDCTATTIS